MARWTLKIRDRFEAAHALRSYRGEPEVLHGHSWTVEAILETEELGEEGMAWDFVEVKTVLRDLAGRFDHGNVNETPPFDRETPTTEHLARWFAEELVRRIDGLPLAEVTVWEGPDCAATYRR